MQIQDALPRPNPLLSAIAGSQSVLLLTAFISYLDDAQILVLATAALEGDRQQKFYKIIVAKLFMAKYMNRVDRSLFYLFYEHPLFAHTERTNTNALAAQLHPYLAQAFAHFEDTLALLRTHTRLLTQQQELQELVETLFFNPDLPLPKMKRETIAMYAQTPLQQHLAMLKVESKDEEEWMEEPLEELKGALEQELVEKLRTEWREEDREKVGRMVLEGYKLGSIKEQLLQDCLTHNLVVLLLGLCSQVAQAYLTILASIDDPMMRFTEFLLRATLYRNIVLSLEEKLPFLTSAYSQIYIKLYNPPPSIPPFSFSRTALSIWLQGVAPQHQKNQKIYAYVVSKLRERSLLARIEDRFEKMPSFYGQLRDALALKQFSEQAKAAAYQQNGNELQLEGFFEDNFEMYEVIAQDYQDYLLDLAVNQYSVHWCGHSQQKTTLVPHYARHLSLLIQQSMRFFNFLTNKINDSFPDELKLSTLRELLKEDLHFQLEKVTCPAILRRIIDSLNDEIRDLVKETQGYVIFGEEILAKYLIGWDFTEKDNLVAYFAAKIGVSEDCPPQLSFYYNLQEDPSATAPQKIEEEEESVQSDGEADVYLSEEEL